MECLKPYQVWYNSKNWKGEDRLKDALVPCGQCIACRITRRTHWAIRMYHESLYWPWSIFVTLTYSDENLPFAGSLRKRSVVLFLKRLRKRLGERSIKYFACGEYGDKFGRPHYHMILFGMFVCENCKSCNWEGSFDKPTGDCEIIRNAWKNDKGEEIGNIRISNLTYDRCRYVAKYIEKTYITDDMKKEREGLLFCKELPFRISSNGIGFDYVMENAKYLQERMWLYHDGKKVGLPLAYKKKLRSIGFNFDEDKCIDYNVERVLKLSQLLKTVKEGEEQDYLDSLKAEQERRLKRRIWNQEIERRKGDV